MTQVSTRIEWRASRDGIGHAHHPGLPRTLCGELVIMEALAWPERLRCVQCIDAAYWSTAERRQ